MYKIKAKPITAEGFRPYGEFTDLMNPVGYATGTFYPDRVLLPFSGVRPVGISPLLIKKTEKMIVEVAEYHNTACEGILALDDDVVVHVAPPTKEPVPELTEAFIVKQGTFIRLNTGVWHYSAMPINKEEAHVLIVLPERIYKTDCYVTEYAKDDQIEIEL